MWLRMKIWASHPPLFFIVLLALLHLILVLNFFICSNNNNSIWSQCSPRGAEEVYSTGDQNQFLQNNQVSSIFTFISLGYDIFRGEGELSLLILPFLALLIFIVLILIIHVVLEKV